ncbi:sensor histidine kinase [Micromonospora maritima]|uniref:histidine kinase n=1 Tax=Micromonospora maritima TaxID=986711 RepID=A0ABW7ZSZ7_9ACTN
MPARLPVRGVLVDGAVALTLTYLVVAATLDPPGPAFTGPVWLVWLTGAALGLSSALRRLRPAPTALVVTAVAATATATGVVGAGVIWVSWAPVGLALYTAAVRSGRTAAVTALVGALAAAAVTVPWFYRRTGIATADAPASEVPLWWQVELGTVAVLLAAAWATGRVVRWRRAVAAESARRSAAEAVAAERLRIAREVHDIVGHSMSLIAVRATVANHVAAHRPDEASAALATIERTSRAALTEIHHLLDVLRTDDDGDAELAPAPGVADLPDLADRLRSVGVPVELRVSGADDLPPGIDRTVYRIAQEALTNVLRHADARRCRVTVRAADDLVRVEVVDDGRTRRAADRRGGGRGLVGMRERVTAYGGTLTTGVRPEGGFQVVADLPYPRREHP